MLSALLLSGCAVVVTSLDVVIVKDNEVNVAVPPVELVVNVCVEDNNAPLTLKDIEDNKGNKITIKGVKCYKA
jgi:LEA14-like dessication related protein